jgi:hypothetical protein
MTIRPHGGFGVAVAAGVGAGAAFDGSCVSAVTVVVPMSAIRNTGNHAALRQRRIAAKYRTRVVTAETVTLAVCPWQFASFIDPSTYLFLLRPGQAVSVHRSQPFAVKFCMAGAAIP